MVENIIEKIREAIQNKVIDPEIGINIVDMGLIYDIRIENNEVRIKMTLTSIGCPDGPQIMQNTHDIAKEASGIPVHVDLVWEPAWNKNMLSQEAKNELMIAL